MGQGIHTKQTTVNLIKSFGVTKHKPTEICLEHFFFLDRN